jgi:hypothetical protein
MSGEQRNRSVNRAEQHKTCCGEQKTESGDEHESGRRLPGGGQNRMTNQTEPDRTKKTGVKLL